MGTKQPVRQAVAERADAFEPALERLRRELVALHTVLDCLAAVAGGAPPPQGAAAGGRSP